MPYFSSEQQLRDLAIKQSYYVKMMFSPIAWLSAQNSIHSWTDVPFPPQPRSIIPQSPGVYAFVATPGIFELEPASGLFYIGKATNLYQRISNYIGEIEKDFKTSGRPHVWVMINKWHGHLRYHYTLTNTPQEAEDLESEMLNAFRPPFNKQFDAEISQEQRAFI